MTAAPTDNYEREGERCVLEEFFLSPASISLAGRDGLTSGSRRHSRESNLHPGLNDLRAGSTDIRLGSRCLDPRRGISLASIEYNE